jgi:hypothetical protein
MNRTNILARSLALAGLLASTACSEPAPGEEDELVLGEAEQGVSMALLQSRSDAIKAVHASHPYIHNPLIFAGIAYAESKMAHCYSEYYYQVETNVCPGPASPDCGGGAVTAGYWDNWNGSYYDCNIQQGGLSMWQFDEGTYSQTLNKWSTTGYWNSQPRDILRVTGSIQAAIDFVLFKAWYSPYTPYFPSYQAMYDWINGIRPVSGNGDYETWLGFLANSYNGQTWGSSGWNAWKTRYRESTAYVYGALGWDPYWYGTGGMNGNTPGGVNRALGVSCMSDTSYGTGWDCGRARDGVTSASSKWTSTGATSTHWITYDLGYYRTVNGFIVRHAGAAGEPAYFNTQQFQIQSGSSWSGPWTDETVVDNNAQASITTRSYYTPKALRFVRLYITDPGIDNYARIPEFEVWGP